MSVNADTDWQKGLECPLTGVMTYIVTRIRRGRAKFGTRNRILLQKIDVKRTFRLVGVSLDRAAAVVYRLDDIIFPDLRLQFGWWRGVEGGIKRDPGSHRAITWVC